MVAIIGVVVFTAVAAFLGAVSNFHDKISNAILSGMVVGVLSIIFFWLILPGIVTYNTELWEEQEDTPISEVEAKVVGDGKIEISYLIDGQYESVSAADDDGDNFSFRYEDVDQPILRTRLDGTPDWVAPWTVGSRQKVFVFPEGYELVLK